MKKILAGITLAAITLTLTASPAFAGNDGRGNKEEKQKNDRGLHLGQIFGQFKKFDNDHGLSQNQFIVYGTVSSVTSTSMVVNTTSSVHVPNLTNNQATIALNADTKVSGKKDNTLVLADVKTGQMVVVTGNVSGSTLTATRVHIWENITNQFSLTGTVGSTTSSSIVVTVTNSKNLPTLNNNLATVNVDANTKYKADRTETVTLADVKVGQTVTITGTVNGTTLNGQTVHIKLPKGKVFGEVTAKTATSVTMKNSVTGVTTTINTDADTKVNINGEAKTVADVQVGDKGFVKFKTKLAGMFAKVVNLFR
jgi:cytoskeletal protein CcmA (bactofilin family)